MAGRYEVSKNERGLFSFVLKAANNEVILRSEMYQTRASAENGIASVRKNCGTMTRYDLREASDGRFYFNLKARNHAVIGSSPLYATAAAREAGLQSVMDHGMADIAD